MVLAAKAADWYKLKALVLRFGQRLILAGDPGTMLVQVNKNGNSWTVEKAWQITELTMRFSSRRTGLKF